MGLFQKNRGCRAGSADLKGRDAPQSGMATVPAPGTLGWGRGERGAAGKFSAEAARCDAAKAGPQGGSGHLRAPAWAPRGSPASAPAGGAKVPPAPARLLGPAGKGPPLEEFPPLGRTARSSETGRGRRSPFPLPPRAPSASL